MPKVPLPNASVTNAKKPPKGGFFVCLNCVTGRFRLRPTEALFRPARRLQAQAIPVTYLVMVSASSVSLKGLVM